MVSPFSSTSTTLYALPVVATHAQGLSLRNFLISLIISMAVFTTEVCIFILLKDRLK